MIVARAVLLKVTASDVSAIAVASTVPGSTARAVIVMVLHAPAARSPIVHCTSAAPLQWPLEETNTRDGGSDSWTITFDAGTSPAFVMLTV